MALTDTHSAHLSLGHILTAPFRAIGRFMVLIMESNSRVQLADRLNAMSDAELQARGLTREEIVPFVFRDHMHI